MFCEGNRPTSSYGLDLGGPGLPPVAFPILALWGCAGTTQKQNPLSSPQNAEHPHHKRIGNFLPSSCDVTEMATFDVSAWCATRLPALLTPKSSEILSDDAKTSSDRISNFHEPSQ